MTELRMAMLRPVSCCRNRFSFVSRSYQKLKHLVNVREILRLSTCLTNLRRVHLHPLDAKFDFCGHP